MVPSSRTINLIVYFFSATFARPVTSQPVYTVYYHSFIPRMKLRSLESSQRMQTPPRLTMHADVSGCPTLGFHTVVFPAAIHTTNSGILVNSAAYHAKHFCNVYESQTNSREKKGRSLGTQLVWNKLAFETSKLAWILWHNNLTFPRKGEAIDQCIGRREPHCNGLFTRISPCQAVMPANQFKIQ